MPAYPNFKYENQCELPVAGVDEVGRGPLAGPVVAAAVILDRKRVPKGIMDSKMLTREERETLFDRICDASQFAIAQASVDEIDTLNILGAVKLAMQRAIAALPCVPAVALVDGNQPPILPCKVQAIVQGDSISRSIAPASIIAKVTRDRLMAQLAEECPGYGFEKHAGYGTKQHQDAIERLGITVHHRRSFAPIRLYLEKRAVA